jgi:RNA polymerase sigma factor (TIGR02999 family)
LIPSVQEVPLPSSQITELLIRWKDGDRAVENALASGIYPVLRELARSQLSRYRGSGAPTLSATELANEAYLKLCDQQGVDWQNRNHFYAIAATVMRRVVIDYLRQRSADKRGGADRLFVALHDVDDKDLPHTGDHVDWLAVDQALTELQAADPACARVVEMRLFSGMTTEQIAEVCGSSVATVGRQWRFARTWLADRLDHPDASRN